MTGFPTHLLLRQGALLGSFISDLLLQVCLIKSVRDPSLTARNYGKDLSCLKKASLDIGFLLRASWDRGALQGPREVHRLLLRKVHHLSSELLVLKSLESSRGLTLIMIVIVLITVIEIVIAIVTVIMIAIVIVNASTNLKTLNF